MKQPFTTDHAPPPAGAYSQAVAAGGFVYTAGAGPQDPHSGALVGTTIQEQTEQVIRNLAAILSAADLGLEHVVKATVHLQDLHRDFAGFDATYRELMPEPLPVRTTVGSTLAGILVEIDFIAAR